jgi:hypothetical protein
MRRFFANRHYVKRARDAESRVAILEAKLDAEREIGRRRDSEWADKLLNAVGLFGLKTPAVVEKPEPERPKGDVPLNALEDAKLSEYQKAAIAAGLHPQEGVNAFWAEKNGTASPFEFVDQPFEG